MAREQFAWADDLDYMMALGGPRWTEPREDGSVLEAQLVAIDMEDIGTLAQLFGSGVGGDMYDEAQKEPPYVLLCYFFKAPGCGWGSGSEYGGRPDFAGRVPKSMRVDSVEDILSCVENPRWVDYDVTFGMGPR